MIYRNTKTGIILEFSQAIAGKDWEPLQAPEDKPTAKEKAGAVKAPAEKAVKNGGKRKQA